MKKTIKKSKYFIILLMVLLALKSCRSSEDIKMEDFEKAKIESVDIKETYIGFTLDRATDENTIGFLYEEDFEDFDKISNQIRDGLTIEYKGLQNKNKTLFMNVKGDAEVNYIILKEIKFLDEQH